MKCAEFCCSRLMGFDSVRGQNSPSPIVLGRSPLTQCWSYRAACNTFYSINSGNEKKTRFVQLVTAPISLIVINFLHYRAKLTKLHLRKNWRKFVLILPRLQQHILPIRYLNSDSLYLRKTAVTMCTFIVTMLREVPFFKEMLATRWTSSLFFVTCSCCCRLNF